MITLGVNDLAYLAKAKPSSPTAKFTVTTTGADTLTIAKLTVSSSMTVDWGDGNQDSYTGTGSRTHNYSGAGTWTVQFMSPALVTELQISDNKVTLNSADVAVCTNITYFYITSLKAGTFNSVQT